MDPELVDRLRADPARHGLDGSFRLHVAFMEGHDAVTPTPWTDSFCRRLVGISGAGDGIGWMGVVRHIVRDELGTESGDEPPDDVLVERLFELLGEFIATRALTDPIDVLARALHDGTLLGVGVGSTVAEVEAVFGTGTQHTWWGPVRHGFVLFQFNVDDVCTEIVVETHRLWLDGPHVVPDAIARGCRPFPRHVSKRQLLDAVQDLGAPIHVDPWWPFRWADTAYVGDGSRVAFPTRCDAPIPCSGTWEIRLLEAPRAAPASAVRREREDSRWRADRGFVELARHVAARPGMFAVPHSYRGLVAYLSGHDHGEGSGRLARFQQWLADRSGLDAATPWWDLVPARVGQPPTDRHPDDEPLVHDLVEQLAEFDRSADAGDRR